jgi:hypothetical protein
MLPEVTGGVVRLACGAVPGFVSLSVSISNNISLDFLRLSYLLHVRLTNVLSRKYPSMYPSTHNLPNLPTVDPSITLIRVPTPSAYHN